MIESHICNNKCSGCSACMAICPKSSISMKENEKGFLYPVIDQISCIDCGLCQKICNSDVEMNIIHSAYIAKIKDSVKHSYSQSGGAFIAIADAIIDEGGVVFGVVADEKFEGVFKIAQNKKECEAMHGSKYMQARVGFAYRDVEKELKEGKKVLFSGTPCQVSALKKYLKGKNVKADNLISVDIICHGVPSVLIWREIMKEAKNKIGDIYQVNWRDKLYKGWGGSVSSFYGKEKYVTDHFFKIFWSNLCLRGSCFECKYASMERTGDITIGDAWGVKQHNPEFSDSRGVSVIFVNSIRGEKLVNSSEESMILEKVDASKYVQKNMKGPSVANRSVDEFWNDYFHKGFSYILKKNGENNLLLNYKYIIKKGVNAICRKK